VPQESYAHIAELDMTDFIEGAGAGISTNPQNGAA
jgi:hypothetical protein